MASAARLRFLPTLSNAHDFTANIHFSARTFPRSSLIRFSRPSNISINACCPENLPLSTLQSKSWKDKFHVNAEISTDSGGNGGSGTDDRNTSGDGNNGGGSNFGGCNNDGDGDSDNSSSSTSTLEILGCLLNVWRQFPLKCLLKEFVGSCWLEFKKLEADFEVCLVVAFGIFLIVTLGIWTILRLLFLVPFGWVRQIFEPL